MYSDKGETLALGYAMQYYATFYNKDIFDKFGVSYPKDGLGWNDLLEIAKKTTREEDGTQYFGMIAGGAAALAQSWALPHVDPKTKKALYNTDGWKKVFELAKTMYSIPGNMPTNAKMGVAAKDFTEDKNVAVIPWFGDTMINSLEALQKQGKPMNWDLVTYPTSPENPGKSHEISFRSLVMSKVSKHKEAAFQVMKYLSTSDEVQTLLSQVGFGPSLKDAKFQKVFGADREVVKGKNISAIFKTTPLLLRQYTDYDGEATKALNAAFNDYLSGKIDVNTALRQAQENADSAIAGMGM
jgi:multiple sugar transport system substrate-binding protein